MNNSVISAFCELEKTLQRELDMQISMARIKRAIIREETGIIKRLYKNKYVTDE